MASCSDDVKTERPSPGGATSVNGSHHAEKKRVKEERSSPVKAARASSPVKPLSSKSTPTIKKKPLPFDSSSDDEKPLMKIKAERTSPVKAATPSKSPSPVKKPVTPIKRKRSGVFDESDDDDDVPLAKRKESPGVKKSASANSIASSAKVKTEKSKPIPKKSTASSSTPKAVKRRKSAAADSDSDDDIPLAKASKRKSTSTPGKKDKVKSEKKSGARSKSSSASASASGVKKETKAERKKREEDEKEVWKWWEEEPNEDGVKWKTLEHKGPVFAPPYEPLPASVQFRYDGKPYQLEAASEEVAGFFGKMLEHEYTTKEIFVTNFWEDFRKEMSAQEKRDIRDFKKCGFQEICDYYKQKSEERKADKEGKLALKEKNLALVKEYGFCLIDGHKEKIGNFRLEPPGLFRGRGDHPKQGKLKRRIVPEDIIINIGEGATIPKAPDGHRWKSVQHENKVTWLVSWTENINGAIKYMMLNATSKLKGEKDWQKYETARRLKVHVDKIRTQYIADWKSKMMSIRQRAVAVYFIDKLALRAGHEKDTDESADTVGCCSLRVEHITLHETYEDKENVVEFDFLGKDSIRYLNHVPVEKQVFKNLKLFMKGKDPSDELFDRLVTTELNAHLSELMPGLTAKVFRTYNASSTLQDQLNKLTKAVANETSKVLSYNRANRAVAILCNHQRTVSKGHDQQMENLQTKIGDKKMLVAEAKKEYKTFKKTGGDTDKSKKKVARLEDQLEKLEIKATDKDENKSIALGTSKLNYLDPRISVAWCKKFSVPLEKVYNRTQRDKFMWAIDMADETFEF